MIGQILGVDGTGGGIINGEDGKRYRFTNDQWRDQYPAAISDQVDFVVDGEQAREIYRYAGGSASTASGKANLNDGTADNAIRGMVTRPHVVLAGMLILSALFLPFMGGFDGENPDYSLVQVHQGLSRLIRLIAVIFNNSAAGDKSALFGAVKIVLLWMRGLTFISYALWLLPLGAALIIISAARNQRKRWLEFLTGTGAALTILYIPLTWLALSGGAGLFKNYLPTVSFRFGAFAMLAIGIGLILTAKDRITRTPGL